MISREHVIRGLRHCKKYGSLGGNNCDGHYEYTDNMQNIIKVNNHRKNCQYGQCKTGCVVTLIDDAITLLKEQGAEIRQSRLALNEAFNTIRDAYNTPANREKILLDYLARNACCCEQKLPIDNGQSAT